jgi:hypothetical protein
MCALRDPEGDLDDPDVLSDAGDDPFDYEMAHFDPNDAPNTVLTDGRQTYFGNKSINIPTDDDEHLRRAGSAAAQSAKGKGNTSDDRLASCVQSFALTF